MKKKSIGALLLSLSLLIGATGATTAYFTNIAKTDVQSIKLGNLKVEFTPTSGNENWNVILRAAANISEARNVDPRSARSLIHDNGYNELEAEGNDISNVAPGDLLLKSFTLKNTGSLDAKVKLSLADMQTLKADGSPFDNSGNLLFGNHLFKAYTLKADGLPGDEVTLVVDGQFPGQFVLDAKSHETIIVYTWVYFDSSINNTGMDRTIKFDVKADATQWNNHGWNEDGTGN
jgi:hypothetical protein